MDEWEKVKLRHPDVEEDLEELKEKIKLKTPTCQRTLYSATSGGQETSKTLLILLTTITIMILIILSVFLGIKIVQKCPK